MLVEKLGKTKLPLVFERKIAFFFVELTEYLTVGG